MRLGKIDVVASQSALLTLHYKYTVTSAGFSFLLLVFMGTASRRTGSVGERLISSDRGIAGGTEKNISVAACPRPDDNTYLADAL